MKSKKKLTTSSKLKISIVHTSHFHNILLTRYYSFIANNRFTRFSCNILVIFLLLPLLVFGSGIDYTQAVLADKVTLSDLEQTISELLLERIPDKRISLELSFNSNSKKEIIDRKFHNIRDVVIENFDPKYSSFKASIIYLDSSTDSISGKYFPLIQVPVAAKYIRYNAIVQESDLTTVSMRFDRLKRGIIADIQDVVGKRAKKQIFAGNMLNEIDLITPPVININDPVNIIFSSGLINLKTTGTALGSGIIGESIKVKNASSGVVLLGEIINKNTVKVGGN